MLTNRLKEMEKLKSAEEKGLINLYISQELIGDPSYLTSYKNREGQQINVFVEDKNGEGK